jgi:hypothetical protein
VSAPTVAALSSLATNLGFARASAMVDALDVGTLTTIVQYRVLPAKNFVADLVAGAPSEATLYAVGAAPATFASSTTDGVKTPGAVLKSGPRSRPPTLPRATA